MSASRRHFLARAWAAVCAAGALASARRVLAVPEQWPEAAFEAKRMDAALQALVGGAIENADGQIMMELPEFAESGAVVPLSVTTTLADVDAVSVLIPNNPRPWIASFMIPKGTQAYVSTRVKMAKDSDVVAIVEAAGKRYSARQRVQVAVGGCS